MKRTDIPLFSRLIILYLRAIRLMEVYYGSWWAPILGNYLPDNCYRRRTARTGRIAGLSWAIVQLIVIVFIILFIIALIASLVRR
jgi:hypothetical protein